MHITNESTEENKSYNDDYVNIFMVSFGLGDYLVESIRQLYKVTKYPFRLIVADNYSWESDKIQQSHNQMIEDGQVAKAYMYGKNYKLNICKHIFPAEPKTKFTVLVD